MSVHYKSHLGEVPRIWCFPWH